MSQLLQDNNKNEAARLRAALTATEHEVKQTLGRALGYPRYCDDQQNFPGTTDTDGVCTGEHVAGSLATEAAAAITNLREKQRTTFAMLVKLEAEMSARWYGDFTGGNHDVRCLYCGFSPPDKDDILCENPDCAMVQTRVFIKQEGNVNHVAS